MIRPPGGALRSRDEIKDMIGWLLTGLLWPSYRLAAMPDAQSNGPLWGQNRGNAEGTFDGEDLLIELLHSADAVATVDALKALCKFANVVALSDEKVVAGSRLMLTSWVVW
jgi:hypothetical protein